MFSTIAYYLGYTGNELTTPNDDIIEPSFVTKETTDQWTLVDVKASKDEEGR